MKRLLMFILLALAGTVTIAPPAVHAIADYSFDCGVDLNGPSNPADNEAAVYLSPGETIVIEAVGCDVVCGEGGSRGTAMCGADSPHGATATSTFTGWGWFSGRSPGDAVVYWIHVVPDYSDVNLQAVAGDGSLTFTWDEIAGASRYTVAVRDFSQFCLVNFGSPTTCTFTGLNNGQNYLFEFRLEWAAVSDMYWYSYDPWTPSVPTTTTSTTSTTTTTSTTSTTTTVVSTTTTPGSTTTYDEVDSDTSVQDTLVVTGGGEASGATAGLLLVVAGLAIGLTLHRRPKERGSF